MKLLPLGRSSSQKYVLSTIIEAEAGGYCSYRYLIYTVLEAGMWSYDPLQFAGLLEFHNEIYDNKEFMNDYELDFSEKGNYPKMTV